MSNITNTDPVVTEAKLTEFYNDIKPFLGCPAYVTQEGDEMYYSTEEKVVGRWHDGKPLYQRTFEGTIANSSNQVLVAMDQTIYTIVYWMTYNYRTNTHEVYPLDGYVDNASSMSTFVAADGLRLYTSAPSYLKDKPFCAVVWYTKTTDSAVTTTEQKPTHYSTDEQVVGTWIDSKPIYQRTWSGINYSIGSSWVSLSSLISNGYCKKVIQAFGNRAEDASFIPLVVYAPNGEIKVASALSSFGDITEITLQYTKNADYA